MKIQLTKLASAAHRIKLGMRTVSFLLSLILLFLFVPPIVYVKAAEALSSDSEEITDVAKPSTEGNGTDTAVDTAREIYEDITLREESVKHFRLPDGSYVAAQYSSPVHTLDELGEWQDIDNTLTESSGIFANKDARIKFRKKITGNETLFTLKDGSTKLELSLEGANKGTVGVVTNGTDTDEDTELGKLMSLEKLTASVLYADILDGTDVEYIADSLSVKENIIVKEKKDSYVYTFSLKLNGMTAALSGDGDVILTDTSTGEAKYVIPAPVVYDAVGAYAPSTAAHYTLASKGSSGKYTLTVTADAEWMNAEERAFPVTVDPTVRYNTTASNVKVVTSSTFSARDGAASGDIFVSPKAKTLMSYAGYSGYIRYDYISSVTVNLYCKYGSGYVAAYQYSNWFDDSTTWSDVSGYGASSSSAPLDYYNVRAGQYYSFDVTKSALYHANDDGYPNVVFVMLDDGYAEFANVTAGGTQNPYITTIYRNMTGVEDYWMGTTQSVGVAGSGSVNLANGNLTFAIPLISTTDSLMPYTVTAIYNQNRAYMASSSNGYMPGGYRLNIGETVERRSYTNLAGESEYYCVHTDEDGTEHAYFYDSTDLCFKDEDGLQLILTNRFLDEDTYEREITILNENTRVKKTFTQKSTNSFYLTKIEDQNGNAILIGYDTTNNRPASMSLLPAGFAEENAILMLGFAYNNGKFAAVYNLTAREAAVFKNAVYLSNTDGQTRREVEFCHFGSDTVGEDFSNYVGNPAGDNGGILVDFVAAYEYDQYGGLISAEDVNSGYKITYGVNYSIQYSYVSQVKEFSAETDDAGNTEYVPGFVTSFNYGRGYAQQTDVGGSDLTPQKTYYNFDEYGRPVNIYSPTYSTGTNIEYEDQENIRNKVKSEYTSENYGVNYLMNGEMLHEKNGNTTSIPYWTIIGDCACDYAGAIISESGAMFNPRGKEIANIYQVVKLKNGTYTFSVHTISNKSKVLRTIVNVSPISGFCFEEDLKGGDGTNEGGKYSKTFTVNSDSGYATVMINICAVTYTVNDNLDGSAWTYLYDAALVKNNTTNSDSIVNDGGFDNSGAMGTVDVGESLLEENVVYLPTSTFWEPSHGTIEIVSTYGKPTGYFGHNGDVMKIVGDIDKNLYLKQRVYTANESTLKYFSDNLASHFFATLSANISANDAVHNENASVGIYVEVTYYQGADYTGAPVKSGMYFKAMPISNWGVFGYIDTRYTGERESGKHYSMVESIDIYCVSSHQIATVAFDNITFSLANENPSNQAVYNSEGLVERVLLAETMDEVLYTYYVYDDDRNLILEASDNGVLLEYTYDSFGRMTSQITSTFKREIDGEESTKWTGNKSDLEITPESKTDYTYDNFGLVTLIEAYPLDSEASEPTRLENSKSIKTINMYETAADSPIFGALLGTGNGVDYGTRYFYDKTDGKLLAEIGLYGADGIAYSYDEKDNLVAALPARLDASGNNYETYAINAVILYQYAPVSNEITRIITQNVTYHFDYTDFGNVNSVYVLDNDTRLEIVGYEYYPDNGNVRKITYANGRVEEFVYNSLELVSEVWYTESGGTRKKVYEFEYTASGEPTRIVDYTHPSGYVKRIEFSYNSKGLCTGYSEFLSHRYAINFEVEYSYDSQDRLTKNSNSLVYSEGDESYKSTLAYNYSYNEKGQIKSYNISTHDRSDTDSFMKHLSGDYTYDALGRIAGSSIDGLSLTNALFQFEYVTAYSYRAVSDTEEAPQVSKYETEIYLDYGFSNLKNTYEYEYNSKGYISEYTHTTDGYAYDEPSVSKFTYRYDYLNRLVSCYDAIEKKQYSYFYDNGGNITEKRVYDCTVVNGEVTEKTLISTVVYEYGDAVWGDRLTKYDGATITYDESGNPLTYYNGTSFSWHGRELYRATVGADNYYFTYNSSGYRASKRVGNEITYYYYEGSLLVAEVTGEQVVRYIYDANGSPLGFMYRDSESAAAEWETFFYEKNIQGDILAIYTTTGMLAVEYTYDAWGNSTETAVISDTNALYNSLRYRGYCYDEDLSLYYLLSRYYDSNTGRFISPDDVSYLGANGDLNSYNLYVYCFNNPVNMYDPDGNWPKWSNIFAVIAVVAVVVVAVAATVVTYGAAAPALVAAGGSLVTAGAAATAASVATTAAVVATVSATAAVVANEIEKSADQTSKNNNSVYVLVDDAGAVQYVGRTVNVKKREAAHRANPFRHGLRMDVLESGLSLKQARALEQAGMAYYHTINSANKMNNQINGVAPKYWGVYKPIALNALKYGWNKMTNEILYWTGN